MVPSDSSNNFQLVLGMSSSSAVQLLDSRRRPGARPCLTLRFENIDVETTAAADELVHRVGNSFLFDVEVQYRISLSIGRLETLARSRYLRARRGGEPQFPRSQYPHAPMVLYRLGRDRSLPGVVSYWCLYQVLEYFFPRYSSQNSLEQLARQLRFPSFDPHRQEDLLERLNIAGSVASYGERPLLATTLEAIVTLGELRAAVDELQLADALKELGESQLSSCLVDVGRGHTLAGHRS